MKTRKRWKCMAVYVAAILLAGGVATAVAVSATGGDATNDINGDRIHTFTTIGNASFTVSGGPLNCQVLVVAGGGGGGSDMGGGGGAGGLIYSVFPAVVSNYTVTVGAGGAGAPAGVSQVRGYNGSNSVFASLIAIGGGGGASEYGNAGSPAGNGGSGGGGSASANTAKGTGTSGQGYDGGVGNGNYYPGGGGGAGGPGANSPANGGVGLESSINGTSYFYAGGGGGSGYTGIGGNGGNGGGGGGAVGTTTGGSGINNGSPGGGGAMSSQCNTPGGNAGANTGGGGGGGSHINLTNKGGYGGSGIVIVKYSLGGPVIGNLATTNVTSTSAYLNGNLNSTGDAPLTAVAVYWGTNDGQFVAGNWANTNTFSPTPLVAGVLTTNIAGLASNTLYYYRFYATNSIGERWASSSATFITGEITVQATRPRSSESGTANGEFTVYRPGWSTNAALTVNYTMSGAASNGVDYALLSGVVTIPTGATNATVAVAPIADGLVESAEAAILTLTGGGIVGSPGNATVTIIAGPTTWYVSTNGLDTNSGTNWAEAFLTIGNGVAWAANGDEVRVGAGTFTVATEVVLSGPIAVIGQGHTGPKSIIRQTGSYRVFTLSHTNARLDGLVVENGYLPQNFGEGGNISMTAGTVTNCVIRNNRCDLKEYGGAGWSANNGGGVYMTGGLIVASDISGNSVGYYDWVYYYGAYCHGGGVYMTGGTLRRTRVFGNAGRISHTMFAMENTGGGVYIAGSGAVVENCLIWSNRVYESVTTEPGYLAGGGVHLSAGTLRNCTIVANANGATAGTSLGGGLWQTGGTSVNCIVWGNTATNVPSNYSSNGVQNATYSCAPELTSGNGNKTNDPLFIAPLSANYRLSLTSPCVDTGTNQSWMITATDMDGNPRILAGRVDMGAYESTPKPGTVISIR